MRTFRLGFRKYATWPKRPSGTGGLHADQRFSCGRGRHGFVVQVESVARVEANCFHGIGEPLILGEVQPHQFPIFAQIVNSDAYEQQTTCNIYRPTVTSKQRGQLALVYTREQREYQ